MKPGSDWTMSELYALEREARADRARELAGLIRAGARALVRVTRKALATPSAGKKVGHA
jgi:hypothetical protein